jgi:DNA-directed RNA polymerase III subunit RPC6
MIADGLIEKIFLHNVAANGHANASSARKRPFEDSDTGSEDEDEAKAKKDEQAKARAKAKAKKAASSSKPKKKKKKGNAMLSDASSGDDVAMADFNSDDDDKPAVQEGGGGGGGGSRRKKNRNKRALDSDEEDAPTSDSSGEEDTAQTAASRKKMLKANHEAMVSGAYHSDYVYRIVPSFEPRTGWIDMPCGECPSQAFCAELPRSPAAHHHRSAPYGRGAPRVGIEIGGMQGVGMMGGAGAAIGASNNKWGDARGVDVGAAPVNPKDCEYFTEWLKF